MSLPPFIPVTGPGGPSRAVPDPVADRRELSRPPAARRSAERGSAAAAARAAAERAAADRAARAEALRDRTREAERDGDVRRREPADFAELLALAAETAAREVRAARALGLPVPAGATDLPVPANPSATPTDVDALLGEAQSRFLPPAGVAGQAAAPGALEPPLPAALDRARLANAGELRARGDDAAAAVRASLDALLGTAGTPWGMALAEAAGAARRAGSAAPAADVTTPVRTPDALAPALRTRLERVMDRMRDEHGHDVQLVETVRSTDRQAHLFAQGRTMPGAVVTWTLDSAHLTGEAVDVIVDGRWQHPVGYQRLQTIAVEEGLQTLGMRDPGHLELRGAASEADRARALQVLAAQTGSAGGAAAGEARREPATGRRGRAGDGAAALGGTPYGQPAYGVAAVAAVARVASVAPVARVATVARAGAGAAAPGDSRRAEGEARRERGAPADGAAGLTTLPSSVTRLLEQGPPRVAPVPGSEAAARAEQIAVLREDAPAPAVAALTVQLDSPDGPEQVRVHVRGGVVGADVSTTNGALADRLRLQTADLQDALGRHGLESDGVRIQSPARALDAEAARLSAGERGELLRALGTAANPGSSSFDQGSRDRAPARHPEREPRPPQDESPNQRRRDSRQEQRS